MTNANRVLPAVFDDSATSWERATYAFLAEKERRSGSRRTVESYSRMLRDFFGRVGKTPDRVTSQDAFAWAHGVGASGREPSGVTVGARIGCVSSFYRFLIRMEIVATNPCDALERPRTEVAPPRGLSADEVRRLLAAIPETPKGRRDRAIVLTLVLTGRRRSEVMRLTAGSIENSDDVVYYTYRGKGGKRGRRELPRPVLEAITLMLADRRATLTDMPGNENLWGITGATFYNRLRRHFDAAGLPPSGVHVLRHTAAKLRRDSGESLEAVSSFLDHSSLAVTTTYLRRLEGERDEAWGKVAVALRLTGPTTDDLTPRSLGNWAARGGNLTA